MAVQCIEKCPGGFLGRLGSRKVGLEAYDYLTIGLSFLGILCPVVCGLKIVLGHLTLCSEGIVA